MQAHESKLLSKVNELAGSINGLRIIGQAEQKVSVFSFILEGLHPSDLGTLLDQQGVAVRTGHHCTQPLMDYLGIPGTCRASFAFYNTEEEVDILFKALSKIVKLFG